MTLSKLKSLFALALAATLPAAASAGTYGSIQSSAKPNGVTIIDKVQLSGSDSAAAAFNVLLPSYLSTCASKLPEGVVFTGAGINQLDPQRLYFYFDYAPRVYFLNEGACYKDGLGATIATVSVPTSKPTTGNTFTIFPDCTTSTSVVCSTGSGKRSTSEPLLAGDFVQLPTVKSGQQLAFFIYSNVVNNVAGNIFYNGSSNNPDNFQHLIAFFPDNSQYIIIGFEDMLNGGDKDCNDVLFVVDIGPNNAAMLRAPSTMPQ